MQSNYGIYEFNILNEHEKYDLVFTKGQFVDKVIEKEFTYVLYAISYFWIQVKYDSKNNKIVGINSFVHGKNLDRYSNLSNLMK